MMRETGRLSVTSRELAGAIRQLLLDAEEQWIVDYDAYADPDHASTGLVAQELSTVVTIEDTSPVNVVLCIVFANGDSFMVDVRPMDTNLHS